MEGLFGMAGRMTGNVEGRPVVWLKVKPPKYREGERGREPTP